MPPPRLVALDDTMYRPSPGTWTSVWVTIGSMVFQARTAEEPRTVLPTKAKVKSVVPVTDISRYEALLFWLLLEASSGVTYWHSPKKRTAAPPPPAVAVTSESRNSSRPALPPLGRGGVPVGYPPVWAFTWYLGPSPPCE